MILNENKGLSSQSRGNESHTRVQCSVNSRHFSLIFFLIFAACSTEKKSQRIPPSVVVEMSAVKITYDWNDDGVMDTAELEPVVDRSDYHELQIKFGVLSETKLQPILSNKKFIWAQAKPGATLKLEPKGDIRITVDDSEQGRKVTVTHFTLSYQDGEFKLTKYSKRTWDRLDKMKGGSCQIDLVKGIGSKRGKFFKFTAGPISLDKLTAKFKPNECEF